MCSTLPSHWPDRAQYTETVQAPDRCFADPDLSDGAVTKNKLGLPLPRSGQFAVVYEVKHWDGRRFAVKCFTKAIPDLQTRYAAITQHLAGLQQPALAEFSYLPQGIRVNGNWLPILKMAWVDGQLLPDYVGDHLHEPDVLRKLAADWRVLIEELRSAGIAHGDLQNGNIKVDGEQLRLVDYDGLYVPALRGQPPGEIGERNFQHPERSAGDYGPEVDNFSALVIELSLLAVAADPSLWTEFHADESLIFRQRDYTLPGQSPIWVRLQTSPDQEVVRLGWELAGYCAGPADAVPPLAQVMGGGTVTAGAQWWKPQPAKPAPPPSPSVSKNGDGLPWYLQPEGQLQPSANGHSAPASTPATNGKPPWWAQPDAAHTAPLSPPAEAPPRRSAPTPASSPAAAATTATVILCPKCHSPNALPINEFYCQHCGEALRGKQRCFCFRRRRIPVGARYCNHCGRTT